MEEEQELHLVSECELYDRERDEEEHRQMLERDLLTFRIQMGTFTVVSILFLTMGCLLIDAVAQSHHWVYHIPVWFVNMCNLAIDAGLLVFSVGVLTVFTRASALNTPKIESKTEPKLIDKE